MSKDLPAIAKGIYRTSRWLRFSAGRTGVLTLLKFLSSGVRKMSMSGNSASWKDQLVGWIVIVIFVITLVLNFLALHYTYVKVRKPSLKKIPHLFVGALSLAGLGIACFQYIPFIASRFNGEWSWEAGVCHFVAFGVLFFGTLTISLVVVMSLERLGAIVFPFCYKESVTFHKCVLLLVALVVYSFLLAILPQALNNVELNVSTGVCSYTVDSHNTDTKVVVYVMSAHYVLSVLVMVLSNVTVVYTLHVLEKKSLSDVYDQDSKPEKGTRVKGSNTSACVSFAKMVALMAVCYSLCWTTILVGGDYLLMISAQGKLPFTNKITLSLNYFDLRALQRVYPLRCLFAKGIIDSVLSMLL